MKALDLIGLPRSAAAVAKARFELELLHDGDALDDAAYARELEALDGLEGTGAWARTRSGVRPGLCWRRDG